MSYASNTAAARGAQTSGIRPSGGMASSMAANMVGSQYVAPSGSMHSSLAANFGPFQYTPKDGIVGPDVIPYANIAVNQSINPATAVARGVRPSGGMGDSLAAVLDYRQYRPSGGLGRFDGSAYGMRSFQPPSAMKAYGDAGPAVPIMYSIPMQYKASGGGMGDALAANLDYRQYRPSGNMTRLDGSAYGMRTFQPSGGMGDALAANLDYRQYQPSSVAPVRGTAVPQSLSDRLGSDGLWYASSGVRPSGYPDGSASTPSDPSAAQIASDVLHQTAGVITSIISEGNANQRAQLDAATRIRIQELQNQGAAAREPALQQQIASQIQAMQAIQTALAQRQQTAPPPAADNTKLYIGLGVAGIVTLGAIGYMATRKNPAACGPGCPCPRCRVNPVIGEGRSRHFVPQHELDRRAARRARRLAK